MWLVLAFATAVAVALRFPFLGHQSLWFDETYTRSILREPTLTGLWDHVKLTESTPPLYYLLEWLIHARSAAAMRLVPALALTVAVPIGYLAFRRLIGPRAALASAAILAVNPMLVAYATDARSYGLFVLTGLLTVWGFSALLDGGSARSFALWAIASIACVWTHYFGVFLVGAEVLVLLALRPPPTRRTTLGWTVLVGVCLIPLIPLIKSQTGNERAGFIAAMPLGKRLTEAVRQFAMGANVPRTWLEAAGLAIFCIAVAAGTWLALRPSAAQEPRASQPSASREPHVSQLSAEQDPRTAQPSASREPHVSQPSAEQDPPAPPSNARQGPRALLALAVIAFGTPLLLSALKIEDRFYARNVIVALPLVAALAAPALLRLRAAPLALYLALATLASVWVATNWRYEQVDWHSAIARAEALEPHAPVIAMTELSAPVAQVYLARRPASAAIATQSVWMIVEPLRSAGERALTPVPIPALSGFTPQRTLQVHGFQLVLLDAAKPTPIAPGEVPEGTVFPSRG
jgi:hypothetical protein